MKALSLWQPWATLVVTGSAQIGSDDRVWKRIETRSWATPYRGPLAIHAAMRLDFFHLQKLRKDLGLRLKPEDCPAGAMLGIVELSDVVEVSKLEGMLDARERALGNYMPGRFGWMLSNPGRFERPIPMAGAQRLWEWTPPEGLRTA